MKNNTPIIQSFLLPSIALIVFVLCQTVIAGSHIPRTDSKGKTPYEYVNPFIGTGGEGHTYPGASVPFGMVQLSPDTTVEHYKKNFKWCAGYQYDDPTILGFSHTHFSGTGHSDLGDLLIMPTVGKINTRSGTHENPDDGFRSRYSHDREHAVPGYYSVVLDDYKIKAELTTSQRAGYHRYTFPESDNAHIIMDLVSSIHNYYDKVVWTYVRVESNTLITGFRQTRGWAETRYFYFAIKFSKPFTSHGFDKADPTTYHYDKPEGYIMNAPEIAGRKIKAFFNFKTRQGETVELKVGISGVGIDGALRNLDTEIPHWNFDRTCANARKLWEKELDSIIIEGTHREKQIFYTSIYHTMLAPVVFMDVDRRYRGMDQKIHSAQNFTNYTIFSLWDTYRAAHPLYTIIKPERVDDMIESMLAHYDQNAFKMLPIWSFHNNETWCMIGYHSVSVIADAYLKGFRRFDAEKAFDAMKTTATRRRYDGLGYYMDLGYVPIDREPEGASKTLEYAYDDWTIAQMAGAMNKTEDYKTFMKRSGYYRNVFDKKTGFMRARNADGSWREPFDPLYARYGGDYTEGNAWQYSWYVPHDIPGLIELMGGKEAFVNKLDRLFTIKTTDKKHFEVEDISGLIGQYAHGNEPSQHIAYLYNYAGQPWRSQERIHQVMENLFDNTPEGICGNEDCGQMSAWYIFSSIGFYPVCPGNGGYDIGKPCIPKATIFLPNGKTFTMSVKHFSPKNKYIRAVRLNDQPLDTPFIHHETIMKGGNLEFTMDSKPNKQWGVKKRIKCN